MWGPVDPEAAARVRSGPTRPSQGMSPSLWKHTAGPGASRHLEPKQQRGGQMWRQLAQTVLQVRHLVSGKDGQALGGSTPGTRGSGPVLGGESVPCGSPRGSGGQGIWWGSRWKGSGECGLRGAAEAKASQTKAWLSLSLSEPYAAVVSLLVQLFCLQDCLWGLSGAEPGLGCGSWCDTNFSGSSNVTCSLPFHCPASLTPNWGCVADFI